MYVWDTPIALEIFGITNDALSHIYTYKRILICTYKHFSAAGKESAICIPLQTAHMVCANAQCTKWNIWPRRAELDWNQTELFMIFRKDESVQQHHAQQAMQPNYISAHGQLLYELSHCVYNVHS